VSCGIFTLEGLGKSAPSLLAEVEELVSIREREVESEVEDGLSIHGCQNCVSRIAVLWSYGGVTGTALLQALCFFQESSYNTTLSIPIFV